ncbi:MAG: hypothetical protein H7836_13580 [Magnetococcus sp. YQC-3]
MPGLLPAIAGLLWSWTSVPLLSGLTVGVSLFFLIRVPMPDWLFFLVKSFLAPLPDESRLTEQLVNMANKARRDGILSLEPIPCDFPVLEAAKNHVVDGIDPDYFSFIMGRGKRTVLAKATAVRDGAIGIVLTWSLLFGFLALHGVANGESARVTLWLGLLFAALLFLVLLWGHFQKLIRDYGSLYDLVTDGMSGIQQGINSRVLEETLLAGRSLEREVTPGTSAVASWQITPEMVQTKLALYLAEDHPRLRRVNATLRVEEEMGSGKGFCFHDLARMDDRSFQTLLREVSVEEWLSALKGASPEIVRQVIGNCSPRAGDILLADLKWEKFLSEEGALKAQRAILEMASRLESEGCIVIMGRGPRALEESLNNFREVGQRAVRAAGRSIRAIRQENALGTLFKEDGSPATEGDKLAEQEMRYEISLAFPEHRLHGEEFGEEGQAADSPYLWAFDPIDGTWSFVNHETTACTVLTLLKGEEIILGLVYNPFTDELFEASPQGCFVNERPLPLLQAGRLTDGVMNYQIPRRMGADIAPLLRMWQDRRVGKLISPGGSPVYAMALVAQGTYAVFVMVPNNRIPYPWDLTAGTALVRQAGGRVTDLNGNDIQPLTHTGWLVAGTNVTVHEEALQCLRQYGLGDTTEDKG